MRGEGVVPSEAHYPSAQAWLDAVYVAGGKIVKDEPDEGEEDENLCTLYLPEGLAPERAMKLQDDALFWLHEVCEEMLTETEAMEFLRAM